jgi:transcriptional regulator with XRE-family HTH domain
MNQPELRDRNYRIRPLDHDPQALRWERASRNMRQIDVAHILGLTQGHYSEIERGFRNLRPGYIVRLAEEFGCGVDRLRAKPQQPAAKQMKHARNESRHYLTKEQIAAARTRLSEPVPDSAAAAEATEERAIANHDRRIHSVA